MKEDQQLQEIEIPEPIVEKWQDIVDIMAELIGIPAALIMRMTQSDAEVFVSSKSEGNPYHAGDREQLRKSGLYCETVINTRDRLLVPNALADEKWKNNPDVKRNMISYLGFPIFLPDREPFGTICVLDSKENAYSETFESLIKNFRDIVQSHLELIYMNAVLGEENKTLSDYLSEIKILRGLVPICSKCKKIRDDKGHWNLMETYIEKHSEASFSHGICPDCSETLYGKKDWYINRKKE